MGGNSWTVRLSAAAEADHRQILRWTVENLGSAPARYYADTLSSALKALGACPSIMGVQKRPEIGNDIRTPCRAKRAQGPTLRQCPRRLIDGREVIDVLRLLDDSMDLERHLPPTEHD